MSEELNKIQKVLRTFKKLLQKNSKDYSSGIKMYRELTPGGEYNEEYDSSFKETKELLRKVSKDENEKSFIVYLNNLPFSTIGNPGREDLNWKEHVKIMEESSNYLKYFDNLKKGCTKIKSTYRVTFDPDKLDAFCSSIIAEVV